MTPRVSRRRPRKQLIRQGDGSLYEASDGRGISLGELRDWLSDGGVFEARRRGSGADCTAQVLQEMLEESFLRNTASGGRVAGLAGPAGPSAVLRQLVELEQRTPRGRDSPADAARSRRERRGAGGVSYLANAGNEPVHTAADDDRSGRE